MTPKHIRAFQIDRQRFHVTDCGDGTLCVTSIHPYDETEYHWARQASKSYWNIYRSGRLTSTVGRHIDGTTVTPEEIAQFLLLADREAKLTPRTAIW